MAQDESDNSGDLDDSDISDDSAQLYLNSIDKAGLNCKIELLWLLMKALWP